MYGLAHCGGESDSGGGSTQALNREMCEAKKHSKVLIDVSGTWTV